MIVAAYDLIFYSSAETLARAAAEDLRRLLVTRSDESAGFGIALSGGRVAQKFFQAAADVFCRQSCLLKGLHFFWGDERMVPPNHAESNYGMAKALLFEPAGIVESQVHRIRGEELPMTAAELATIDLGEFNRAGLNGDPVLDLVLLGMGEDGHVASLFPGEPESDRLNRAWFRPVLAAKPPAQRVTVSYGVIAAAREVWVLASGNGKAAALKASLAPDGATPLARVIQLRERTRVLTDIVLEPEW